MTDNEPTTPAQLGIDRSDQIILALQAMAENHGTADIQRIYAAVEEKMSERGFGLSEQGKATLRSYINRDAVEQGLVFKTDDGWGITTAGKEHLEKIRAAEIIEDDEDTGLVDTYADGSVYPYSMPEEVDIREDPQTVFGWMRKLEGKQLIIDPEFQRNLVWKPVQKSRFIESVLLNIPLPPLFANQTNEGKYVIVNGLQRTHTLWQFTHDEFALEKLEVLSRLNSLRWCELDSTLRARIEDRKLSIYVIKPSVPLAMVYDIFYRINTGGTQLTRQEVRNCLYLGKATRLLNELAEYDCFRRAIDGGISPKRMKDREAVLRFLAFTIFSYELDYKNDMDAFLGDAMKWIKSMREDELDELRHIFQRVDGPDLRLLWKKELQAANSLYKRCRQYRSTGSSQPLLREQA